MNFMKDIYRKSRRDDNFIDYNCVNHVISSRLQTKMGIVKNFKAFIINCQFVRNEKFCDESSFSLRMENFIMNGDFKMILDTLFPV